MNPDEMMKSALRERADSLHDSVDSEIGLAAVHRRNAPARRMARVGAGLGAFILLVGAAVFGFASLGGDGNDDGVEVATDASLPQTADDAAEAAAGGEPATDGDVAGNRTLDGPGGDDAATNPATGSADPGDQPGDADEAGEGVAEPDHEGDADEGTPPSENPPVPDNGREAPDMPEGADYFAIDRALWDVVNVRSDDVLNVRRGPSIDEAMVGSLAHDATEVRTTGGAARLANGAYWYEIRFDSADGDYGWVNATFLERSALAGGTGFDDLACEVSAAQIAGAEPPSEGPFFPRDGGDPGAVRPELVTITSESGSVPGDSGLTCERAVLTLSTDGLGEVVGFRSETGLRMELPMVADAFQTELVEAGIYVARSSDDVLYADLYQRPGLTEVRFFQNPARIVIDHVPLLRGNNLVVAPMLDTTDVLVSGLFGPDGLLPVSPGDAIELPITVTGHARPFEATMAVEVRDVNGIVVPATLAGPTLLGDRPPYGLMTTDWTTAWGDFTFTIDDLGPGDYVLALSAGWDEASGTDLWRELPFTVG